MNISNFWFFTDILKEEMNKPIIAEEVEKEGVIDFSKTNKSVVQAHKEFFWDNLWNVLGLNFTNEEKEKFVKDWDELFLEEDNDEIDLEELKRIWEELSKKFKNLPSDKQDEIIKKIQKLLPLASEEEKPFIWEFLSKHRIF